MLAEAAQAAKLLADRGLTAGLEHPADGARPAGNPLITCDAYGRDQPIYPSKSSRG